MSPILKRDVGEQIRQAKRLASVITGHTLENGHDQGYEQIHHTPSKHDYHNEHENGNAYATSSSSRRGIGIGVEGEEEDTGPPGLRRGSWERKTFAQAHAQSVKGKERALEEDEEDEEGMERLAMLPLSLDESGSGGMRMVGGRTAVEWFRDEVLTMSPTRWVDLRNLLLEATPALLLNLVGMIFTGELLEHLARWTVFLRVDELFILVPMIGNLKGNLEMCLSARLGTSANIGELDKRSTRKSLLKANMSLLALQALSIASLAAVISFVLGLMTRHRLGDIDAGGSGTVEPGPGLENQDQEWHEGYTRPGWAQLVMVLATGMGSAGLSSAILGSFMSSMIVVARWFGIDPDNITAPVATCLGDLLTLFILALLGSMLVGTMDTPIPLIAVILMGLAAVWFTRAVMQDEWVKNVAKGGWAPLIGAMLISSGTGMALDAGVGRYRGFALLAIAMTGLTGSIGAIHANRLSTHLHTSLSKPKHHGSSPSHSEQIVTSKGLTGPQSMLTLWLLSFPTMGCFYIFVLWIGWIDVELGVWGWIGYAITVTLSLALAHSMTLFFWSKDLDPDSYTLPIHSALVDFLGQLILMAVFEICNSTGGDVMVKELSD